MYAFSFMPFSFIKVFERDCFVWGSLSINELAIMLKDVVIDNGKVIDNNFKWEAFYFIH